MTTEEYKIAVLLTDSKAVIYWAFRSRYIVCKEFSKVTGYPNLNESYGKRFFNTEHQAWKEAYHILYKS